MSAANLFKNVDGFCSDCGSILPPLGPIGGVVCYACSGKFGPEVFKGYKVHYTVHFNSREQFASKDDQNTEQDEDEGPVVDRKCAQCGNEKMSYATVQLRSADEGQTVFYTCTKCKFKDSENS